jgi:ABC-2 type transport system permease protein
MPVKKLRRFFLWYGLITKRLLKKPSYLILLLAVPVLTAAMNLAAQKDVGLVTVALAGGENDAVALRAKEELLHAPGLLRCIGYDSAEEAMEAVKSAQADAAWIFREDAGEELRKLVTSSGSRGAVLVVEREETVFLRLAREELASVLYPTASRMTFRDHLASLSGDRPLPDDSVLEPYYRTLSEGQQVLVFTYDDGQVQEPPRDFLTNPLRGLLSLVVVLSGLASCMFYYAEEEAESFLRIRGGLGLLLPLLCHVCAMVPVALAGLIAMAVSGMLYGFWVELLLSALLCLASAGFCEALRRLCRGPELLGAFLPILMMVMLVLSPIFLHFKQFAILRSLLPTVYYLNGAYRGAVQARFLLYTLIALALGTLLPPPVKGK